jgi:ceramide glucosyltransferase
VAPLTLLAGGWLACVASVAAWAAIKSRPRAFGQIPPSTRVCVVRPCAGDEHGLERALLSTANAKLSARHDVRFAVAREDDPAFVVASRVALTLTRRGIDARVVVTGARGPNAKAEQIARVVAGVTCDVVLVADSDVDLDGTDLDALLAPLADERTAAAWAPPIEVEPATPADRASASVLDASTHAFAVLGALDAGGMVGKLVALRATDLSEVGGFSSLVECLGEDMELARRFRALGKGVQRVNEPARSLARGRTWSSAVARYARWIAVIRAQRPALLASYALVIAPTLPLVVLTLAAAALEGPRALAIGLGAAVVRLLVAALARRRSGSRRTSSLLVDAATSDALLWAAFVRALGTTRVMWRGVALEITRGGALRRETP